MKFIIPKSPLILLLIFCLSQLLSCTKDEPIPDNLTLRTQADVDAFNYTTIRGNLTIRGELIYDLSALSKLTHIGGSLFISDNDLLPSLNGLQNITAVDSGLYLSYNFALTSLDGLSGLTSVGFIISVAANRQLASLSGLNNLKAFNGFLNVSSNDNFLSLEGFDYSAVSSIGISRNNALKDLKGLESIKELGSLGLEGNMGLTSLNGLQNLTRVDGQLYIMSNGRLRNLRGLDGLRYVDRFSIYSSDSLQSLEGLNNLQHVNYFSIGRDVYGGGLSNPMLTNFCAVGSLLASIDSAQVLISYNSYNPTHQQFANGQCAK